MRLRLKSLACSRQKQLPFRIQLEKLRQIIRICPDRRNRRIDSSRQLDESVNCRNALSHLPDTPRQAKVPRARRPDLRGVLRDEAPRRDPVSG
jgi:hypothetical protein